MNEQKNLSVLVSQPSQLKREFVKALNVCQKDDVFELRFPNDIAYENRIQLAVELANCAKQYGFELVSPHSNRSNTLKYKLCESPKLGELNMDFSERYTMKVTKLFEKVFQEKMPESYWRWKYHYDDSKYSVVMLKDGDVVGHFGCVPRSVWYLGQVFPVVQGGGVMVDPAWRGKLGSSVFGKLVKLGIKQFADSGANLMTQSPLCIFGFPHGRMLSLGERVGGYSTLGNIYDIKIDLSAFDSSFSAPLFDQGADKHDLKPIWVRAWQRMQDSSDQVVLGVRNWPYATRRYLTHPKYQYRYYVNNSNHAVVVLRSINESQWLLIDYVGDLSEFKVNALRCAAALKLEFGQGSMSFWGMEAVANQFLTLSVVSRTSAALAARFFGEGNALSEAPWWISMGDSDFL